jgi:AraC family transcriptional regulator
MSRDNLWRVFKNTFGQTIGNYIRARVLTHIARKMVSLGGSISDLVQEYGFDSPEVFTRAFKRQFLTTPEAYRKNKRNMKFYERQKLTLRVIRHYLKGGISLSPGTVNINSFEITGMKFGIRMKNAVADAVAGSLKFFRRWDRLFPRGEKKFYAYITASGGLDINRFPEDGAIEVINGNFLERDLPGFVKKKIPGGRYAVFMHRGSLADILASYEYIFAVWLRRRMKKRSRGFFFELVNRKFDLSGNFEIEIYVPL